MSACEVFNYQDEPFNSGLSARQLYRISKIALMFEVSGLKSAFVFMYFVISMFLNMPGTISYCSVIEYTNI